MKLTKGCLEFENGTLIATVYVAGLVMDTSPGAIDFTESLTKEQKEELGDFMRQRWTAWKHGCPEGRICYPPWTAEQVAALNRWQKNDHVHPFTCPNRLHDTECVLIATRLGWFCRGCNYVQEWAHAFMAE